VYGTVLSTGETVVNVVNWMETEVSGYEFSLGQVGVVITESDSLVAKNLWTGKT
jgi:hypothetical protein